MPHRIHKCTNILYNYAIIINTYVSLLNELKKMERYLGVNLLGPGPRLIKKRTYRAAVSQRLRNTVLGSYTTYKGQVHHVASLNL